ncbi:GIY-YIG nuclease family protein [Candidatus Kaiserbacteria bacterium]|nr:GIY-YIG nuclease family protein [Candidatus Kaiserbacteria bacterium]
MEKKDLKKNIPDTPGVYFFLGARKEILYIGKATSLRNRVQSYFSSDIKEKRSELIEKMVIEAKTVEWTETDSVLEALIMETNLIRTHTPRYNTVSKDNKSFNHLIITKEEFPRVLVVRGKDLVEQYDEGDIQYHFGPFPSGGLFREALKIIQRIFQFYDTPQPVGKEKSKMAKGKVDFNRQIGLYPDMQSKEEYKKTIRHIRLFFEGKKKQVIKELEKEMKELAKKERFEEAQDVKKKIFALQHIQDVALIKEDARVYRDEKNARIEGYDVAHLSGKDMVGVMTVVEGLTPQKEEYRKFKIKTVDKSNDPAALKEILERRLTHVEWPLPQVIVVDGSTAQKNVAEKVLKEAGVVIPVIGVVKNAQHKPQRIIGSRALIEKYHDSILLVNAEAHRFAISYHRKKRGDMLK